MVVIMSNKNKSDADEFEHLIYMAIEIAKESNEEVTLNDKIYDPDNQKQLRQLDITIKNGNNLCIVECRNHKVRQNTKWIEELYGRKSSLNADKIIGVSKSGFTKGAIAKAKRFSIPLHHLESQNLKHVTFWNKLLELKITCLIFHEMIITVPCEEFVKWESAFKNKELPQSVDKYLFTLVNQAASMCEELFPKYKENKDTIAHLSFNGSFPDINRNIVSKEYLIECQIGLEEMKIPISIIQFLQSESNDLSKNSFIKYDFGETKIALNENGKIYTRLDLTRMKLGKNRMFRFVEIQADEVIDFEKLELWNPQMIRPDFRDWNIVIKTT